MRVLKFGGTSVANSDRLKSVTDIILSQFKSDNIVWAVVSAFSGVTDLLLDAMADAQSNNISYQDKYNQFIQKVHSIAQGLLNSSSYTEITQDLEENHNKLNKLLSGIFLVQEASAKTKDLVLSFGERNSAYILNAYLKELGYTSQYVDASSFIKTDNTFGKAIVDFNITNQLISSQLNENGKIYIITGFIGSTKENNLTTTLGRGGSDYTAAIFAAALNVSALEIWTDVNGVLTTNPKLVETAYPIPVMSYEEAAEMSHFGAKVLYAPTIRPVKEKQIDTWIKNTFQPKEKGTLICNSTTSNNDRIITGLSSINHLSLLSIEGSGMQGIPGIAGRFFTSLAKGLINIIMITQASSENSISIAIQTHSRALAIKLLEEEFRLEIRNGFINPIRYEDNICLVAVIGENMKNTPGVAGKLFHTLGKNGINLEAIAQGSSELNITFAIKEDLEAKALNCIHDAFFLSEYKTVHLYMIGFGLIGTTLLQQLEKNKTALLEEHKIDFILNGISNTKKMIINQTSLSFSNCKRLLDEKGESTKLDYFISKMIADKYTHKIFIDTTASKSISSRYEEILNQNIAISTPNKYALSGAIEKYRSIKKLSLLKGIPFNFETNVGAGLPVISSIRSLRSSGDKIQKIVAVLSGSLSYIFNNFKAGVSFTEIVRQAQEKGYTEPDPREDLSGSDVKRKLLILARESGYEIEENDIKLKGILSSACLEADNIHSFYQELEKDKTLDTLVKNAESNNKKLRFLASFEKGKAEIGLKTVDDSNPFYGLSDSDNMIAIYTDRYNSNPLVIRGPGAGAEVTAAGVLAELVNISSLL